MSETGVRNDHNAEVSATAWTIVGDYASDGADNDAERVGERRGF